MNTSTSLVECQALTFNFRSALCIFPVSILLVTVIGTTTSTFQDKLGKPVPER